MNAADGYQVWSERYDRQLEDVFAIQDEISLAIVEAMKVRLLGGEKVALVKRHTENVETFHLYLRGRHHWQSWSPDGFAKATVYMQQAALSDPNYPLPQVGLADITIASATIGVAPYSELVPKARAHVARALALDPDLDMAWTIASIVHFHAWEMTAARQAAGKAIALNPRLAHAHAAAACAYLGEGDGARGLAPARRAVELEPLSPQWNYILGVMHLIRDEPQPAYEVAQSMLDVIPQAWTAHHVQGNVHYGAGRYEAAVRAFAEAARYSGDSPIALGALSSALAANGDRDRAEQILADLVARYEHGFCLALPMAVASAGLGRIDDAFIWLERSIAQTDIWLRTAWWNPVCRALRDDPRMLDLMRRMRIEPH